MIAYDRKMLSLTYSLGPIAGLVSVLSQVQDVETNNKLQKRETSLSIFNLSTTERNLKRIRKQRHDYACQVVKLIGHTGMNSLVMHGWRWWIGDYLA